MNEERVQISEELRIIPGLAIAIAIAAFACVQVLFQTVVAHGHNPPPPVARVFLGILAGTVLGVYVLAIGYVNRDARRRGMSAAIWTLVVIFVPNAIGFIIYFVTRHPLLMTCPNCHATVSGGINFCPKCSYSFRPACPQCKHALGAGDAFCANCGLPVQKA